MEATQTVNSVYSTWARSLDLETKTPTEGVNTGKIPEWLEGTLIRNGSGVFEIGDTKMNHLFDGLSVIHRFSMSKGKSTYQNIILKSDTYNESKAANRLTVHQFGTFAYPDPCKSFLGKLMNRFESVITAEKTDNCAVNVCYIGDKLYAMTETTRIREIEPETLEVVGEKLNVSDFVAVNHSTAHPHVDLDGTIYNMGNSIGSSGPMYNVVEFPAGEAAFKSAKIVTSFPSRWKMSHSYYHSFGITDNYFIFVEYPLVLDSTKILAMNMTQKSFDQCLEWCPTKNTQIYLAERKTGKLVGTCYEAAPFFAFHHGNAYEKDGHVIIDVAGCKDATIFTDLSLKSIRANEGNFTHSYYTRYILPLKDEGAAAMKSPGSDNLVEMEGSKAKSYWVNDKTIFCEPEQLSDQNVELPRINYAHNGKEYQFVYGISMLDGYAESAKILKIDVKSGEVKEWTKAGFTPSEPIYVPRPNSNAEDDGIILFSALDQVDPKKVLLVILNASTLQEEVVVEYQATGIVPKDFHGIFTANH